MSGFLDSLPHGVQVDLSPAPDDTRGMLSQPRDVGARHPQGTAQTVEFGFVLRSDDDSNLEAPGGSFALRSFRPGSGGRVVLVPHYFTPRHHCRET